MSRAHRGERRRAARAARRAEHQWEGVTVGWAGSPDPDSPDAKLAMQGTHDALIRMMGAQRTGGVRWRFFTDSEAQRVLDDLTVGVINPALSDHYRHLRGLLREHGGALVVATAPGRRPKGV